MAANDLLPFGTAGGANVIAQAAYAALNARSTGFVSGVADSATVNKVLRQTSFTSSMVGQFSAQYAALDVLDNGDLNGYQGVFTAALQTVIDTRISLGGWATVASVNAEASSRAAAVSTEATARVAADANEAALRANADAAINTQFALYPPTSRFDAVGGTNGYQKLPSGIILQWGRMTTPTGNQDTVTFPITFPSNAIAAVACEGNASGWGLPPTPTICGITLSNASSMLLSSCVLLAGAMTYRSGVSVSWYAIGI